MVLAPVLAWVPPPLTVTIGTLCHSQMRTIIGGAASCCQRHSMPQQRFDCTQLITFLEGHETGGSSGHLHPGCSSNTMNIVLRTIRQIVIHYVSDICHVNPAGCNIRRDENSDLSSFKSVESTEALGQTSVSLDDYE